NQVESGSRSWKENPCTVHLSDQSNSSGSTSMRSSRPTTKTPSRSSGPKPKFISVASKGDVSVNCDSGYQRAGRPPPRNSSQYGSLSSAAGVVDLRWDVMGEPTDRHLSIY